MRPIHRRAIQSPLPPIPPVRREQDDAPTFEPSHHPFPPILIQRHEKPTPPGRCSRESSETRVIQTTKVQLLLLPPYGRRRGPGGMRHHLGLLGAPADCLGSPRSWLLEKRLNLRGEGRCRGRASSEEEAARGSHAPKQILPAQVLRAGIRAVVLP